MKRLWVVLAGLLLCGGVGGTIGVCQAILVLDEQCQGSSSYFPRALDNLGYKYTLTSDEEELVAALSNGGPWDLIVVDEYLHRLGTDTLSRLEAYVKAGGRLYMNHWAWNESLAAALGAVLVPESRYTKPLQIYAWEPEHPLFTTPNRFASLVPAKDTCGADGAKFKPAEGSLALAGYTTSSAAGEAALIIGNEGRTVLFGGIIGLFSGDEDQDGREDGLEFAENVVRYFFPNGKRCPVCPVCEPLFADLSADEMESILDELDLSYDRIDFLGTPIWFVSIDTETVTIYLFSKTTTDRYSGIQFVFFAVDIPADAAIIARWNSEYRGSRAYIDDDGEAVLEAELYLAGGVSRKLVAAYLKRFTRSVQEFLKVLRGE